MNLGEVIIIIIFALATGFPVALLVLAALVSNLFEGEKEEDSQVLKDE